MKRLELLEFFCQQLPDELLEEFRQKHIGAKTILEMLKPREWEQSDDGPGVFCLECQCSYPTHGERCLLHSVLESYRPYSPTPYR